MKPRLSRVMPWAARLAWLAVALVGGAAIESATADRSDAVRWTAAIGSWVLWGVVTAALVVAAVRSLTIVRLFAPLSLAATAAAGLAGASPTDLVALGVPSFLAVAAAFTADFGRHFVQASAYGDEERFVLRPPAAAGAAAVLSWVLWSACLLSGPLLLAARSWVAGAVLSALAVVGFVLLGPRWHRLSLRWLVYVPAGVVLHDPVVLADTLMLRRRQVAGIRLAPADTGAADLTGPASGYAIEIATTETVTTVLAFTPQEPDGRALHLRAFLVCPSRPGEALRVAADRGLPVS